MSDAVRVDVWSDIACPWCYIGKRRFEEGLRRYAAAGGTRDIEVVYHSFELAPDTPTDFEGSEVDFLVRHKGLTGEQARRMLDQITELAASEGLAYDFEALRHTRTLKAHEVLHLARAHGVQYELKERLLRAYFEEGRHLGRDEELAELAAEVGLDRSEVLETLAAATYRDAVAADIAQAHVYGIRGVPFFVIDERYGVSGAQDPEVFAQVLAQASEERARAS